MNSPVWDSQITEILKIDSKKEQVGIEEYAPEIVPIPKNATWLTSIMELKFHLSKSKLINLLGWLFSGYDEF